ncbi:uncharacterized protein DS421_3g73250 [Arachis hypogaea]|nr:uncharacterized protein DS421_3g73250 [Arachis hypogaea]
MDEVDPNRLKRCGLCRQLSHTRRSCPYGGGARGSAARSGVYCFLYYCAFIFVSCITFYRIALLVVHRIMLYCCLGMLVAFCVFLSRCM